MSLRIFSSSSRWVTAAALLALLPFVRLPFLVISLAAIGLRLASRPDRPAAYEGFVVLINVLALPFVAGSIWPGSPYPVLLTVAGLPWIEATLRRAGASIVGSQIPSGARTRQMTPFLTALTTGLLIQVLIGVVADQMILWGSAALLLGFLTALVTVTYIYVPQRFVTVRTPMVRVLAQETVEATSTLSSRARVPIGLMIEAPSSWMSIDPPAVVMDREGEVQVRVRLTPPLAGPSTVFVTAMAIDPWGLTVARQEVPLVRLHVIPRGAYAAWLARRYLEQTRGGGVSAVTMPEAGRMGRVRRGLDYYGARPYEPGDVLRDIFWKHTLKLNQLIVKERRDEYEEAVIIAVNLSARNAEEADWLAYTLLMSTLTLARETVPLAFAAYTPHDIVAVTPPLAPRLAVKHVLGLTDAIQVAPRPTRVLRASQAARLRRNISRLQGAGTAPATRLGQILGLEYGVLLHRARTHPACAALTRTVSTVLPPAAVLIISPTLEEGDALEVALERLQQKGIHVIHHLTEDRSVHAPTRPHADRRSHWSGRSPSRNRRPGRFFQPSPPGRYPPHRGKDIQPPA